MRYKRYDPILHAVDLIARSRWALQVSQQTRERVRKRREETAEQEHPRWCARRYLLLPTKTAE